MIDLRQLILRIDEKKNILSHLCLDVDCKIQGEDPKPLIKTINYILNFLKAAAEGEIQISLDAQKENFILVFVAYTQRPAASFLSEPLKEFLNSYKAKIEHVHEPLKYFQVKLTFPK
jgi:hypothetical protein